MEEIEKTLSTMVDLSGVKIDDALVDMFVERIIYRGDNEFVWVMDLSGKATGVERNYRISSYDEGYADYLKDDANFDILAQFVIPLSDCYKFCEKEAKRQIKPKHWQPLVIKVAVV